ncbi:MAG: anti-sigma factor [Pseudomonadota bacterium]
MKLHNPTLRNAIAGEYVLGTLSPRARARFERLLEFDPALRGEVEGWEAKLYPAILAIPDASPPRRVWTHIKRRITPQALRREPWWSGVRLWQGASALASVIAMTFAFLFTQIEPAASYVVVMTHDDNADASWVLSGRANHATLKVRAMHPGPIGPERGFQLWVLPQAESKVRPVGMLPRSGASELALTPALQAVLARAQKFGVSVEARSGSETGQPTTTPLYHGTPLSL